MDYEKLLKKKDESNLACLARLYEEKKAEVKKDECDPERLDKILKLIDKVEGSLSKKEKKALRVARGEGWTLQDKLKVVEIAATILGALCGGAAALVNHEKNNVDKYRIDSSNSNLDRLAEFEQEGSIRTFSGRETAKESIRR